MAHIRLLDCLRVPCVFADSFLFRASMRAILKVMASTNAFGLRNVLAREPGIVAYHALLPLERIRLAHVPQQVWEEKLPGLLIRGRPIVRMFNELYSVYWAMRPRFSSSSSCWTSSPRQC
jgi:hypothetical protein